MNFLCARPMLTVAFPPGAISTYSGQDDGVEEGTGAKFDQTVAFDSRRRCLTRLSNALHLPRIVTYS